MDELVQLIANSEKLNVNVQDKDGNTPLHIALIHENLKVIHYLASNFQCDINLCNNSGYLPLHYAVKLNVEWIRHGIISELEANNMFMEALKAVSKNCTLLHKQNCSGLTPLHIACMKERMDIVRYLVFEKKCFPNLCDSPDTYSNLDVHLACKKECDIDLLKVIANKLNVNNHKHDEYSRGTHNTPLHVACMHKNLPAIKLLKELSCDFTPINSQGMLPLHIACSKSFECVKLLGIMNDDVRRCDGKGNTPLHYACMHNLEDIVRYLVSKFNCDIAIQNKDDEFPLHLACSTNLEIVKMVSDPNLNFNSQTKEGNAPLHIACRAGKTDIVRYLKNTYKCEPSMKVRNRYDRLPVHYACMHDLEMVKLVDQTSTLKDLMSWSTCFSYLTEKISALDIACLYGVVDIVKYLINQKECTLSVLKNDHSAMGYACGILSINNDNKDILLDNDTNCSAHPKVVEYLITQCGYDPTVSFKKDYLTCSSTFEHACRTNNLELIKVLAVLSVDIIDSMGNTPLHYACKHSCTDIVRFLVNHGCDQTIFNHRGELAMHIACHHDKSLKIIELLTKCDINSPTMTDDASTPLHIACLSEQHTIINYLVGREDYDVNAPNGHGETALHMSFQISFEVTELLIKCNVNCTNADGNTVLHKACEYDDHERINYFLQDEACRVDIQNSSGNLPLHIIMRRCWGTKDADFFKKTVNVKILQKCDVNSQNVDGDTALHIACLVQNYRGIIYLLDNDSELCRADIPNKSGNLPLHIIALEYCKTLKFSPIWYHSSEEFTLAEKLKVIKNIIDQYSKATTTPNIEGLTPMDIVIKKGDTDLVKIILKESEIDLSRSPFVHIACKHGNTELLNCLIEYDADTESIDNDGNLPEHICISSDNSSMETLLALGTLNVHRKNNFGDTILHLACRKNEKNILQYILSISGNHISAFSIQNSDGDTPLHVLASQVGISPQLLSLIKCSDPNQRNKCGNTPLHIACKANNIKFAELLLDLHCDPNIHNDQGELPLHIAASQSLELVKLLATSENIDVQRNDGDTPLHIACRYLRMTISLYLISKLNCSVYLLNEDLDTPFHVLLNSGLRDTTAVLQNIPESLHEKQNANGETLLHIACRKGNVTMVKFLIESLKVNVDLINEKSGATPLHFACGRYSIDMVKLVSECSPVTQIRDSSFADLEGITCISGDTPLHIACRRGDLKIIRYLLSKGHTQALQICNSLNELPFHLVCHHNEKLISVFVQYGAYFDCNTANTSGDTALHIACRNNPIASFIKHFVSQMKCKTDVVNKDGDLPLHISCRSLIVHHKVLQMLSNELSKDQLMFQNTNGNTALHDLLGYPHDYRLSGNLRSAAEVLVKRMPNISIGNVIGKQPIHLACQHQRLHVVRYMCMSELVPTITCDSTIKPSIASAVLHDACLNNNAGVLEYIIENSTEIDINVPNENGDLPLHLATRKRICTKSTILLIKKTKNINHTNHQGNTPLHELYNDTDDLSPPNNQSRYGQYCDNNYDRLEVLQCLLNVLDIDLSIQNSSGQTPLHLICMASNKYYRDLEVIISQKNIDVNIQDNKGLTPLHIVCQNNHLKGVQLLLLTSKLNTNPSIKDNQGQMPITLTNDLDIVNLLIDHGADPQHLYNIMFEDVFSDGPPPTPVKVLVVGNPSVGKTTLIQSLRIESSKPITLSDEVEHTAGVVTTNFSSKIYGYVEFYDFAGQPEYYASHDAIIHSTITNVPPVVLILVKLTDSLKEIKCHVHYWINFIAKRCEEFRDAAHIIVVCSHADVLESDPSIKVSAVQKFVTSELIGKHILLKGILYINCTQSHSSEMERLQHLLTNSTNELREEGVMHFKSHCFYALLKETKNRNFITLDHIISKLKFKSKDSHKNPLRLLSSDHDKVIQICKDLDNNGHIMFIEHPSFVALSWLVLNKQPLFHDLVGTLFAPLSFPQHRPLSYSTGVVPLSYFMKHFHELHNHTAIMKLTFLARMEYCREITDKTVLESIVEQEGYSETDKYYFFPNLVSLEQPIDKWNTDPNYVYKSGWFIQCKMEGDFFSPHFIQALLLRLVFAFVPKNQTYDSRDITVDGGESDEEEDQAMTLVIKRVCSVWKNGVYWREQSGVVTIVEIVNQRTLVLLMQCPQGSEVQLIKRRSSIISMVFNAKNEFCSGAKLVEYFLHPECVKHPFNLEKKMTFSILDIQNSIKQFGYISGGKMHVTNCYDKIVDLDQLLYFEPYSELSAETVIELFDEAKSHRQVKHDLLLSIASQLKCRYHLLVCLCHILNIKIKRSLEADDTNKLLSTLKQVQQKSGGGTYHYIRGLLSQISIFHGRLPPQVGALKSHGGLAQNEAQDDTDVLHYQPQEHQLDLIEGNGKDVRVIKKIASRWEDVAVRLHFDLDVIKCIKKDNNYICIPSCREVFSRWLKGEGRQPADWEILIKALKEAEFSELAEELQTILLTKSK